MEQCVICQRENVEEMGMYKPLSYGGRAPIVRCPRCGKYAIEQDAIDELQTIEEQRDELTPIFRAPDKGGNAYLCPAQTARRFVYAAVCTTRAQYAAS